jgi:hypothetical protein
MLLVGMNRDAQAKALKAFVAPPWAKPAMAGAKRSHTSNIASGAKYLHNHLTKKRKSFFSDTSELLCSQKECIIFQ